MELYEDHSTLRFLRLPRARVAKIRELRRQHFALVGVVWELLKLWNSQNKCNKVPTNRFPMDFPTENHWKLSKLSTFRFLRLPRARIAKVRESRRQHFALVGIVWKLWKFRNSQNKLNNCQKMNFLCISLGKSIEIHKGNPKFKCLRLPRARHADALVGIVWNLLKFWNSQNKLKNAKNNIDILCISIKKSNNRCIAIRS